LSSLRAIRTRISRSAVGPSYYLQRWIFYEHTANPHGCAGPLRHRRPAVTGDHTDELFVPAVVIDISDKVRRDHDAEVTIDDSSRSNGGTDESRGVPPCSCTGGGRRGSARLTSTAARTRAAGTTSRIRRRGHRLADRSSEHHRDRRRYDEPRSWPVRHLRRPRELARRRPLGTGEPPQHRGHPPVGTELFVGLIPWEEGSGGPCRVIARW
jgi:hypothetical protein